MRHFRNKDRTDPKITFVSHTYDEYIQIIKTFHGHVAPGVVIGGFMVDMAVGFLKEGELFDAVCETRACLPDAVQLLTPCTIGNGWLKIVDLGRYALSLYEKYTGIGVRVSIDPEKLKNWPEINHWFFKLKPKHTQDKTSLIEEIKAAGSSILIVRDVTLDPDVIHREHRDHFHICPLCHESFPAKDGEVCLGCLGKISLFRPHRSRREQGPKHAPAKGR